jgi:hypothetical protein
LKLIDSVENRPFDTTKINYQDYYIILGNYTAKGGAFSMVSSDILPFLKNKDSINSKQIGSALFGSYYAGCIIECNETNKWVNTAYRGIQYALKTYNKIKQVVPDFVIPKMDSLNDSTNMAQYKDYLNIKMKEYMKRLKIQHE